MSYAGRNQLFGCFDKRKKQEKRKKKKIHDKEKKVVYQYLGATFKYRKTTFKLHWICEKIVICNMCVMMTEI